MGGFSKLGHPSSFHFLHPPSSSTSLATSVAFRFLLSCPRLGRSSEAPDGALQDVLHVGHGVLDGKGMHWLAGWLTYWLAGWLAG